MIDTTGIDRAELVAALHNNTKAIGMGRLHDLGRDITPDEVRAELKYLTIDPEGTEPSHYYIDYYHGRPLKVAYLNRVIDEWGYDRDAGKGAFQRVVDSLRAK